MVAIFAYLMPPTTPPSTAVSSSSPPASSPDRVITRPSPSPADSSPESSTSRAPSRTPVVQDSPSPLPEVRSVGCDEAAAALTSYRRNAGTSRSGQAATAQQTYRDLMGAALNAQGAVGATIRRLAAEFQELNFRLNGMTGGDPNQVIADINTDIAEFNRLCAFA
ncbi:hypothetical protein [Nonomuraea rubra]|uniref:Uncharacterized protein n=1 Tax=Nonomuraea rubra TaxID=46180 RepID=A0A7X0TXC6_9ACTN|nr:hypothetical protein [Nonomuraea rubra]MBB6547049.1 hypothetical protein [Nonomuraea rubra]